MNTVLVHGRLNDMGNDISVIPLNIQDHLILYKGQVVGMYHRDHKVARLLNATDSIEVWQWLEEGEGFAIQYSNEPFGLNQWTNQGTKSCAEIIYHSNDGPDKEQPEPSDMVPNKCLQCGDNTKTDAADDVYCSDACYKLSQDY